MKQRARLPDITTMSLAIAAALGTAWIAYATLGALATPSHLKARLDGVETTANRAENASNDARGPHAYLPQAVCSAPPSGAAQVVQAELVAAAADAGIAGARLSVTPSEAVETRSLIAPVSFEVSGNARHDVVIAFLERLSQVEPQVFADTMDMTSTVSAVSFRLTGRVYCRARA